MRAAEGEMTEFFWDLILDRNPHGALVLFLPDGDSVVLRNSVLFFILRLPIVTSKCDPVLTAQISFSRFTFVLL